MSGRIIAKLQPIEKKDTKVIGVEMKWKVKAHGIVQPYFITIENRPWIEEC